MVDTAFSMPFCAFAYKRLIHYLAGLWEGYEQELQLREVSRSKLQRKGIQLMASKPRLVDEIGAKLEALNQQWHALQQHIAPSPLLARKSSSARTPHAFSSSEQAMSLVLEVEDVIGQLKAWLTQMEARLFESDGSQDTPPQLGQLESRLRSIQDLKDEIDRNNQSVDVVLKLCSLLQDDDRYLSTHQRERESLQLGAINVERRWQNVKTQSEEMLAHAQEKVESVKGSSSGSSSGDEQRSQTPDLPFIMEESAEESDHEDTKPSIPSQSENSLHFIPAIFQPSGAKDDDMVDGYGNRMHNHGRSIEYDDILVAREAFSENDAFSISDASEVSVEDFAFDDHLPMKDEVEDREEVDLDDDLALPLSETPDIMELTDDMLDAYLQMEEELIQEVEEEEKTSQAAAALEFWSMSPREENMLKMEDIVKMHAALRGENNEHEIVEEDEDISEREEMSFEKMCSAYSQAVATLEEHNCRLDSVGSDFLSEEAEEALECMASDEEVGDEYDGDLDDDCFYQKDAVHDITLQEDGMFAEETQEFNDDFAGWMIGSMEDVAEYPNSLEIDYLNSHGSSEGRRTSEDGDYPDNEEEGGNDTGDDLPDICPDDSIFSCEGDASSSLSPLLMTTWPQENPRFFPPICKETSPADSLFSSLRSLSSTPDLGSFFKASRLFPSLVHTDDVLSDDEQEERMSPVHLFQSGSLRQGRRSHLSNEKAEEKDNLLEITDISLTHMYESLDFVTELVHQIAPEERSETFDHKSRYNSFSEAVERTELKASHSLSDSFDIVANIVRRMVPSYDDEPASEEEITTASRHTNSREDVHNFSQSGKPTDQDFQEVDSPSTTVLSESLPLSHSLWQQDCVHTLTGSFDYTWPVGTANCESSECKELASIQAAVKHTLTNALREEGSLKTMMGEEPVRKSKKSRRNKRKAASPVSEALSVQQDGAEGSCTGSCDTGFNSLLSTDDEKSCQDTMKLSEVESPCTLVDDTDATPTKSGYMSYVSQIAEACSEGNLDQYLSTKKHKQCYLWSVPPAAADTPEEVAIKGEIGELEQDVSDLLLTTEELEKKWELDSQATDNTDRLLEATNTLVEELKRGQGLDADDIEEDKVGSWKDVIVLWMDKNGKVRDAETQGCTPITVPSDYMQLNGSHMTPIVEVITSTAEGDQHKDTPKESTAPTKPLRGLESGGDQTDSRTSMQSGHREFAERTVARSRDASEQYEEPVRSKSFLRRVLSAALPIQILLFLCTILVLVLPTFVVTYHGDCYLSLIDNLMLDSSGPVMNYVRGPPPV